MLKQRVILEVKAPSEKVYRFECETDSPLGEIYDVLHQMSETVVQNIQRKQEVRKPKSEEKKEACCNEGQPCEAPQEQNAQPEEVNEEPSPS